MTIRASLSGKLFGEIDIDGAFEGSASLKAGEHKAGAMAGEYFILGSGGRRETSSETRRFRQAEALTNSLPDLEAALRRMELILPDETPHVEPLVGGVSSDISLVEVNGRRFCVKRALSQLKVAAEWRAPVQRNAAEAAWMRAAADWLPHAAPIVLGEDEEAGLFAMEYFDPIDHPLWKVELLAGRVDALFAAAVGRDLATIHAKSAADPSVGLRFANDETFEAIRIEPYLRATGRAHPALTNIFDELARRTAAAKFALVHGDISPKNILIGPRGPIFLDAECAWYGDPGFDLAFCLNHLLLKGARDGATRGPYLVAFRALADAYLAGVDWEPMEALEMRAASLLPALFLARVDGKSPVEYLITDIERNRVRAFATSMIASPPRRLNDIAEAWGSHR
jgi:aminoglycoside phosphotransferase (APT) family kinase protein